MSDIGRTSFIPKETAGMTPGKIRRKRTFHVFGFLATASLLASLVFAGGVYFLDTVTNSKLESAKKSLIEQKSLFKAESIAEVREFDRRLQAAMELLRNHVAPLKIFAALERDTKQKIQFTSFTLDHTPSLEMLVTLEGTTEEFKTLALQEVQFSENQLLRNLTFKEISSDADAEDQQSAPMIIFSLKGSIDPFLVRYDGTPTFSVPPVAFIDANETLTVVDGGAVVLGEAVTREEI